MKTILNYAIAGAVFTFAPLASADEHEGGKMVSHAVKASSVDGATIWDYNGNKIGSIEHVLLIPGKSALAVIDTSILDDDRKIVVPWRNVQVQTKEGDKDDIIYALDADKAKLMAAPKFTGEQDLWGAEVMAANKYWMTKNERMNLKDRVKKGVKKAADAIEDAADEVEDEVDDAVESR